MMRRQWKRLTMVMVLKKKPNVLDFKLPPKVDVPTVERVTTMGNDQVSESDSSDTEDIFGTMRNVVTAKGSSNSEVDIYVNMDVQKVENEAVHGEIEIAEEIPLPDEENLEQENDGNRVEQCVDCSEYKIGRVSDVDGLFYCNECWISYEEG
eukprot:975062_1